MNRKTTGIALAVIASAGIAQAQIAYGPGAGVTGVQIPTYSFVDMDGNTAFHPGFGTDVGVIETGAFLLPTRTTLQDSFDLDTTGFASIDQLQTSAEFTGETRPDYFEFSWNTEIHTDFADVINSSGASLFIDPIATLGSQGLSIGFTENTRIRISLDMEVTGQVGETLGSAGSLSNLAQWSFSGSGLPNAFTAGVGVASNLGASFTGEFDVLAGQIVNMDFWIDNFAENDAIFVDGFTDLDQINRGSLIVEVVPAPASVGVFALGGLITSRRRRSSPTA